MTTPTATPVTAGSAVDAGALPARGKFGQAMFTVRQYPIIP